MTSQPDDGDFDERWRALESPYRRRIAALAYSGRTSDDPLEASLVLGFARRRLHPGELGGAIAVVVVAYVAIAQVFFSGPDALIVALLVAAVATLFAVRRGRLETAVAESEESLKNVPPRAQERDEATDDTEEDGDDQDPVA